MMENKNDSKVSDLSISLKYEITNQSDKKHLDIIHTYI